MARRHGTRAKYSNDGCRCHSCTVAAKHYDANRRPSTRAPYYLPELTAADDAWMEQGACRTSDLPVSAFFPTRGEPAALRAALEVCESCPDRVVDECLDFALRHHLDGVWGRTSQRQRRKMKARVA